MKRLLLCIISLGLIVQGLYSQESTCSDVLREAQQFFDDGLLGDIPSFIEDCLEDGFTKEEKANAYKLLIQTHLFSDELELADQVMLDFLREFPSYSLAANDPTEFVNLYRTYRTDPIYKLEAQAGVKWDIPLLRQKYGTGDTQNSAEEYYANAGVNIEIDYVNTLSGNFEYGAGLAFAYTRLGYSDIPHDYTEIYITYSSMMLGVPLSVRYRYPIGFIDLYARAGVEPAFLISYNADVTRTDETRNDPITDSYAVTEFHNRFDVLPFLGAGAYLDLGRDQLILSFTYKFGTISQLKADKISWDIENAVKFRNIENNILYNKGFISLSYVRPIYNPKKIQ